MWALDPVLATKHRAVLVQFAHRAYTAESQLAEKLYEIGRSRYATRSMGQFREQVAIAKDAWRDKVISAAKRMLRALPEAAQAKVRAMQPGTARPWLSRDEIARGD